MNWCKVGQPLFRPCTHRTWPASSLRLFFVPRMGGGPESLATKTKKEKGTNPRRLTYPRGWGFKEEIGCHLWRASRPGRQTLTLECSLFAGHCRSTTKEAPLTRQLKVWREKRAPSILNMSPGMIHQRELWSGSTTWVNFLGGCRRMGGSESGAEEA